MGILTYMQNDPNTAANPPASPEEDEFPSEGDKMDDTGGAEEKPYPNLEKETQTHDFPLPDTFEGGTGSSVITVFPRPIIPCFFCGTGEYGLIRFLNAAAGYQSFLISISGQLAVNGLSNGEMSQYGRVLAGTQNITVSGQNGYVYIEKQYTVKMNRAFTLAIINTESGLDIMEIEDIHCNGGINTGCFRVCNLSITNRKIHVALNGGVVTFRSVNYQEVTSFQYVSTGFYMVSVSNGNVSLGNVLLTANIYLRGNASYTLYVFNWSNLEDAIRILIVEDRRT